jgi:hypothetical protein
MRTARKNTSEVSFHPRWTSLAEGVRRWSEMRLAYGVPRRPIEAKPLSMKDVRGVRCGIARGTINSMLTQAPGRGTELTTSGCQWAAPRHR